MMGETEKTLRELEDLEKNPIYDFLCRFMGNPKDRILKREENLQLLYSSSKLIYIVYATR